VPDRRRGRTLSSRARGAKQIVHYGPLQRLLDRHFLKQLVGHRHVVSVVKPLGLGAAQSEFWASGGKISEVCVHTATSLPRGR